MDIRQDVPDWWRYAVIYQIHPRSFFDADGDGVGDLDGIRHKLDYIEALGADAIGLCQFARTPMREFDQDVSDFAAVDPVFGTLDDFSDLVAEAHGRGLRVIIDQIWNHTSAQHPWFRQSRSSRDNPKAGWYVWADPGPDGKPPNNWMSIFGGSAWTYHEARKQYYLHHLLSEQPHLNWYQPEVRAALMDVARFWMDLGVDGFRLDGINLYAHDRSLKDHAMREALVSRTDDAVSWAFLEEIRALVDTYPGRYLIGAVSAVEDPLVVAAELVKGQRRLHSICSESLASHETLTGGVLGGLMRRVQSTLGDFGVCWTFGVYGSPRARDGGPHLRFLDDADEHRLDRLRAALEVCLPGSCCINQGDELGLAQTVQGRVESPDLCGISDHPDMLGGNDLRPPMPWTEEAVLASSDTAGSTAGVEVSEYLPLAVSVQDDHPHSLLNVYRRFLNWRRWQPALRGRLVWPEQATASGILMFDRIHDTQQLRCVFNFSAESVEIELGCAGWRLCDEPLLSGHCARKRLSLPAYGACVLEHLGPRH